MPHDAPPPVASRHSASVSPAAVEVTGTGPAGKITNIDNVIEIDGIASGAAADPAVAPVAPASPATGWLRAVAGSRTLTAGLVRVAPWVVIAACIAGSVFRFLTPSHLWLDEALTVDIASRPIPDLFAALRHDGSPPLYYLLLRFWIHLFGTGDVAVRSLSGVLSVATLPLAWLAGRRVGRYAAQTYGLSPRIAQRTGIATLLLFASSPYAIRYGSETRMYSLLVLLVLAFGLVLVRAVERPRLRRWVLVWLTTAALAYTHYWSFLLLGSTAFGLWWQARRHPERRGPYYRALLSMIAAAVLFAPWMPIFTFQMLHTGTPWAPPVHAQVLLDTVFDWAGPASTGALLGLILLICAGVGLTAHPSRDGTRLDVDLHGRAPGRALAWLWLMPLALAYLAYVAGGSAYAERYTGIALPSFLLLAALGIGLLPDRRVAAGVLLVATITGLAGGFSLAQQERTQAGQIAAAITRLARPGDVVAYCPDQLGPAVYRALSRNPATPALKEIAYADRTGPQLVNWVDYGFRMEHASGAAFAEQINRLAGPDHAIFLVRADGYRTLGNACASISGQLASFRDQTVIMSRRPVLEGATLLRYATES